MQYVNVIVTVARAIAIEKKTRVVIKAQLYFLGRRVLSLVIVGPGTERFVAGLIARLILILRIVLALGSLAIFITDEINDRALFSLSPGIGCTIAAFHNDP